MGRDLTALSPGPNMHQVPKWPVEDGTSWWPSRGMSFQKESYGMRDPKAGVCERSLESRRWRLGRRCWRRTGHDDAWVVFEKGEHDPRDPRGCNCRNHAVFSRSGSQIRTFPWSCGAFVRLQAAEADREPCFRVALARGGFAGWVTAAHDFGFPGNPGGGDDAMKSRAAMVEHWVWSKDCQRHTAEKVLDARVY